MSLQRRLHLVSGLSLRYKVLAFASLVVLVELAFRRWPRRSSAYGSWTAFFKAIGAVWTAVLLSVVYLCPWARSAS